MPRPNESRLYQSVFAGWAYLVAPFVSGKRLLDFGCGAGNFWNAAQEAGWDAYGVDIGIALIAAARRHWSTERLASVSLAELQQQYASYFDVVNASQVFEHLADPKQMAQELKIVLRAGGLLTIDIPNVDFWRERLRRGTVLDVPAHFFYFSPNTIRCLLEESGYRVLAVSSGFEARRVFRRLREDPYKVARIAAWMKKVSLGGGTIQVVAQRENGSGHSV
jgi:SAM-dependent methyltransferase